MKVTVTGNACVLTSSLKVDDIKLVKKYKPEALAIKNDKGTEVFRISYSEGNSNIASFGVTFGGKSLDENGFAQVTTIVPEEATASNVKELAADLVAPIQGYVEELEDSIPDVVTEINTARNEIIDNITVS